MPIKLRFSGRWVFAQEGATGIVYAVAPLYPVPFRRHLPLMSVEHEDIKFKDHPGGTIITTRDPLVRPDRGTGSHPRNSNVDPHQKDGTDTQLLTWDLMGARVRYAFHTNQSTLPGTRPERAQVDIQNLAAGTVFDRRALTPPTHSAAVIEIRGANGEHTQMIDNREIALLPRNAPAPPPGHPVPTFVPADLVEFTLPAMGDLTVHIDHSDGGGDVVLKNEGTITFAHMCAAVRRDLSRVDHEFSQYYTLLTPPPDTSQVPVPVEDPNRLILAAEGGDCDCIAYVEQF